MALKWKGFAPSTTLDLMYSRHPACGIQKCMFEYQTSSGKSCVLKRRKPNFPINLGRNANETATETIATMPWKQRHSGQ
jgi:hypothetical protein